MKIPSYTANKDNIGIRPYSIDDARALHEAIVQSLEHMTRYVPWSGSGYSMEEAYSWVESRARLWERGEQFSFIIYSLKDNRLLGFVDIDRIDQTHRCANLGYWVRKDSINKSIATTATELAAKFAFQELKLNRLEIVTDIDNLASQRVAEKIGAKKEGVLRNRFFHHGAAHSAVVYSLIPEDLIVNDHVMH